MEGNFGVGRIRNFHNIIIRITKIHFEFLLYTVVIEEFMDHAKAEIDEEHQNNEGQPLGDTRALATLSLDSDEIWFDVDVVFSEKTVQFMNYVEFL